MSRSMKSILQVLIAFVFIVGAFGTSIVQPVMAVSDTVVISQVYGGGGNTDAYYRNDFVELYNASSNPVDVGGWSVQLTSAASTAWTPIIFPAGKSIGAGGYFLVQLSAGSNTLAQPLPTPGVEGTYALGASSGKVALVNNSTALTGANPSSSSLVDLVGFGSTATGSEGSPALGASNTMSVVRKNGGCLDTDNNANDFSATTSNADNPPRNSSTTAYVCPADPAPFVNSTLPLNNGTAQKTDNIMITFSEPVTVADGWYNISCGTSSSHTALVTDADPAYTLDPAVDFAVGETCTVTIYADKVTDEDAPLDPMYANYVFSFSIPESCGDPFTPIYDIQGSGATSLRTGDVVTTEGVVTADFRTGNKGFYIQEPKPDTNPLTSEGMFIYSTNASYAFLPGDRVRLKGTVSEYNGLTEMGTIQSVLNCGLPPQSITPVELGLPFTNTTTSVEPFENMLVHISQPLVINEYYQYDQFGEITLGSKRLDNPTNVVAPWAAAIALQALNDLDKIVLDDGSSASNPAYLRHPDGKRFCQGTLLDTAPTDCPSVHIFRGGDLVSNITAVLDYYYNTKAKANFWRLQPIEPAEFESVNPRTTAPVLVAGELRISSINTLNYFITLDNTTVGSVCGPLGNQACRGAVSDEERLRQRAKTVAAVTGMASDVTGLLELENDNPTTTSTLGEDYAIASIVAGLNEAAGSITYAYIPTGDIGGDVIKAGIVYKPARVTPVGNFALLTSTVDPDFIDTCNRPVLAQTFRDNTTQQLFTVAINHLKSKGTACAALNDEDAHDGQGAANLTRTKAAGAEVRWLEGDPTNTGSKMYLIMGDLNSYAMEDPITALKNGADGVAGSADDYFDLVQRFREPGSPPSYGYVYGAQAGYLDGALANRLLASYVLDAKEWHINSDEVDAIDYTFATYKKADQKALYQPDAYRSSDHDPILVSLMLNHDPIPVDDTYTTGKNQVLVISKAQGVLANDTDANIYDTLRAGLATPPTYGQVTLAQDGSFIYTPAPDFVGVDTFEYTMYATPGLMGAYTNNAKVTITVTENAPFVGDKHYEAVKGFELKVGAGKGLLENAVTEPNRTLTAVLVLAPAHGTLILLPDGSFSYISDPNFIGDDEFLYKITGGVIESPVYVGTIHVKEFFTYYLPIIAK